MRGGRPDLRRTDARDAGVVRRQGDGAGAGRELGVPVLAGISPRSRWRRREPSCGLGPAGRDAEGGRRRRRPGHAAGTSRATWTRPSPARSEARGASARVRSMSRSCCPRRGTSRSRSSATGRARSPTCGTASAAFSASARSSSRSPRRSASDALRDAMLDAAVRLARRSLSRRRHDRVPGRRPAGRGGAVRVHRGQRPAAGRAHRHRGGPRPRPGRPPVEDRRRRDLAARPSQDLVPAPRGVALQARVNLETMTADGSAGPAAACSPPMIRPPVRACASMVSATPATPPPRATTRCLPRSSSRPTTWAARGRARRALSEFKITGPRTNVGFLQALLKSPAIAGGALHTRYVEEHLAALLARPGPGALLRAGRRAASPGRRQGRSEGSAGGAGSEAGRPGADGRPTLGRGPLPGRAPTARCRWPRRSRAW